MRMRIFSRFATIRTQLKYYIHVRGDESRWAQNTIIELAISLKTRKRNLFYYTFKCGPTVFHCRCMYTYFILHCGLSLGMELECTR